MEDFCNFPDQIKFEVTQDWLCKDSKQKKSKNNYCEDILK
jgi:hypothetical protein